MSLGPLNPGGGTPRTQLTAKGQKQLKEIAKKHEQYGMLNTPKEEQHIAQHGGLGGTHRKDLFG